MPEVVSSELTSAGVGEGQGRGRMGWGMAAMGDECIGSRRSRNGSVGVCHILPLPSKP